MNLVTSNFFFKIQKFSSLHKSLCDHGIDYICIPLITYPYLISRIVSFAHFRRKKKIFERTSQKKFTTLSISTQLICFNFVIQISNQKFPLSFFNFYFIFLYYF